MVAVEIEDDGSGQSERREADRADRADRFSVNAGEAEELVIPRKKRVKREEWAASMDRSVGKRDISQDTGRWFSEWPSNGVEAWWVEVAPVSEHKISGHKSTTVRPPLYSMVRAR